MGAVLDLLDQIAEMMGKERMEFELFAGVLETGLAELKMGLVPPALDQVLVGTMDRTRVSGVKYAFLLGFNEGVVPAQFKEDGILSEESVCCWRMPVWSWLPAHPASCWMSAS